MSPICTVFLDRDGVINRNRPDYVKNWSEFQFLPGARWAIAQLSRAGYRVFVVTNQASVGKGIVSPAELDVVHRHMIHDVGAIGGRIEAILCCPHRADAGCDCRKPLPGLFVRAQQSYGVVLRHAIFIGDSVSDVQAAAAAGVSPMVVLTGLGWRTVLNLARDSRLNCQVALNLAHAAHLVLARNAAPTVEASWLRRVVSGASTLEHLGVAWGRTG